MSKKDEVLQEAIKLLERAAQAEDGKREKRRDPKCTRGATHGIRLKRDDNSDLDYFIHFEDLERYAVDVKIGDDDEEGEYDIEVKPQGKHETFRLEGTAWQR